MYGRSVSSQVETGVRRRPRRPVDHRGSHDPLPPWTGARAPGGPSKALLSVLIVLLAVSARWASAAGMLVGWPQALAALVFAIAIPVGVGVIPAVVIDQHRNRSRPHLSSTFALAAAVGIPTTVALALLADRVGLAPAASVATVGVGGLATIPWVTLFALPAGLRPHHGTIFPVAGLLAAIGLAVVVRFSSPYPLHPTWDWLVHLSAIDAVLAGEFSLWPADLSDSFKANQYTTFFHAALASGMFIASVEVADGLGMSWLAPFVVLPVAVIAAARYAEKALRLPNGFAWVAAGVAVLIQQWGQPMAGIYVLPASVAGVVALLGASARSVRNAWLGLAIAAMIHPLMALLAIPLLIPRVLAVSASALVRVAIGTGLLAVTVFPEVMPSLEVELNPLVSESWPSYASPLSEQWRSVTSSMTRPFLLVVALSAIATGALGRRTDTTLLMLAAYLLITIAPIAGTERAIGFVPLLLASTLLLDLHYLTIRTTGIGWTPALAVAAVLSAGIVGGVQARSTSPLRTFLDQTTVSGVTSSVSWSELRLAELISEIPSSSEVVVVSDPDTQNIIGALAGARSLGGAPFPPDDVEAAAAAAIGDPWNRPVFEDLRDVVVRYYGDSAASAPILIVYTARTERWLGSQERAYNPATVVFPERIEALSQLEFGEVLVRSASEILVLSAD